jgi:UDP-glucose 4-epimerase
MLRLKDAGHRVLGIDSAPLPDHLQGVADYFVFRDFADQDSIAEMHRWQPDAIIHCAGTSLVGPSLTTPGIYYHNNVVKTLTLLGNVLTLMPKCRVIFSSSASVYGQPIMTPCHEVDPREPISPYGESKMMVEQILESYHRANGLDYVAFRYFNACGADSQGRHGQAPGATHVIARLLESIRDDQVFTINGNDYNTDDGTCVRDYVHVEDIAEAHIRALDRDVPAGVYNLGNSTGISVMQILTKCNEITGKTPVVGFGPRRQGDPDTLTASSDKFDRVAPGWRKYDLDHMIQHAWRWYVR